MQKIMFNDRYGLTGAVLDGRKTMTRRIIPKDIAETLIIEGDDIFPDIPCEGLMEYSRYKVGEEIAVAQSYKDISQEAGISTPSWLVAKAGWTNKMFVKAKLMPHRIRITDIRIERLQDISDEDCLREGIYEVPFCEFAWEDNGKTFKTAREAFAALIDKVSGKGTWESNPYVWVYSFRTN